MDRTFQQHLFCTKDDSVHILTALEATVKVRYWILDEVVMNGKFHCPTNVAQLCQKVELGVSSHGQPLDLTIGVQFPPFRDMPKRNTARGVKIEGGKADLLLFSPGGLYSAAGEELVSGRLAVSLHGNCNFAGAHQMESERYYHKVLELLREQGAVEHGMYLIGKNALSAFEAGLRLVYQTGMTPLASPNRN